MWQDKRGLSSDLVFHSHPFDVVVVAASAGGIPAIQYILSCLPADFPIPIVVVQHMAPSEQHKSILPKVLACYTDLPVKWAEEAERCVGSCVYIAPQDHHLLVSPEGTFILSRYEKINHVQPAADPLFESVAVRFKERTVGVVLSGYHCDGAEGAKRIKEAGGRVIVQDKRTSFSFQMPHATLCATEVDFVLPLEKIAAALVSLVMAPGAAMLFRVTLSSKSLIR